MTSGRAVKVIAITVLIYLVSPLFIVIAVSFTASDFLVFPPSGITLKWYQQFLQDSSYISSIVLSAVLAIAASLLSVLFGVPAAIGLKRYDFKGRDWIQAIFLSPLALPGIVIGAAMLQFSYVLNIDRTIWLLIIAHTVIGTPYVIRTTLVALHEGLLTLEDAARDLGASEFVLFFTVTLPGIKPGVVAGLLFAFIISWINVEVSLFNATSDLMPIPLKILNYVVYQADPMIAAVAAFTIYIGIVFVVLVDLIVGIDKVATTRS